MNKLLRLILLTFVTIHACMCAEEPSPGLDERLGAAISIYSEADNLIGYIHIPKDRSIDESTYLYVKFALEHYKKLGVCFILLDLNTPGGEVFAAMKIARRAPRDPHPRGGHPQGLLQQMS